MNSQHSMGLDAACKDTVLPVGWLMWTRKTIRTRVFLRPMSVSPFLSSMSELRSFKIPAQSILRYVWRLVWDEQLCQIQVCLRGKSACASMTYILSELIRLWFIHRCGQIKSDFHSGIHQQSPKGGWRHVNRRLTPPPPTEPLHLSAPTLGWSSIETNGWERSGDDFS